MQVLTHFPEMWTSPHISDIFPPLLLHPDTFTFNAAEVSRGTSCFTPLGFTKVLYVMLCWRSVIQDGGGTVVDCFWLFNYARVHVCESKLYY